MHWQVKSYAKHTAADKVLKDLGVLVDVYVEAYMGRHGAVSVDGPLDMYDKADPVKYVKSVREKLMSFKITESDLASVRDDMVLVLNRTLYLFTLK
jgi:hypothetical protein